MGVLGAAVDAVLLDLAVEAVLLVMVRVVVIVVVLAGERMVVVVMLAFASIVAVVVAVLILAGRVIVRVVVIRVLLQVVLNGELNVVDVLALDELLLATVEVLIPDEEHGCRANNDRATICQWSALLKPQPNDVTV